MPTKWVSEMTSKQVKRLAGVVRSFLDNSKREIEGVRCYSQEQGRAPDWPWNRFVHAFASNGGTWYWEDEVYPNYEQYSWATVESLTDHERKKRLADATNPLRRKRFSPFFEQVFQRIRKAGGPKAVKKEYNAISTAEARIAYWKEFPGIGDKYSREIPMRSYDPFFLNDHFAVDARLRSILKKLFDIPPNYRSAESFFVSVARELKTDCWTLDTVLYDHYKDIEAELDH
jgi:hypothetical protein